MNVASTADSMQNHRSVLGNMEVGTGDGTDGNMEVGTGNGTDGEWTVVHKRKCGKATSLDATSGAEQAKERKEIDSEIVSLKNNYLVYV